MIVFEILSNLIPISILILILYSCIIITREKQAKPVLLFGKFSFIAEAGLKIKLPWPFMTTQEPISLQVRKQSQQIDIKTKDNAFLKMPVHVQYQVMESRIYEAYYSLDNPESQIMDYIMNTIRAKAKAMTVEEMYGQTSELKEEVNEKLTSKMEQYGYRIIDVLVDDPQPDKSVQDAYNRVIASKREQEAATNEAEALRIKRVGEAKAEGESLEIKAQAIKKQREIWAEGCKESFEKLSDAMPGVTNSQILAFLGDIDMRDAIRDAANKEGNVIIMPAGTAGADIGTISALQKALSK